ncbi:hypothetical protein SAY87_013046 [Trapa incisa]|uniref:Uncharacterized protein n=1 Tax=Trapa incisa TaxID=236973 RepID=A0AAN7QCR9_9MYRT|nr:hypothetical protein SAY87_013046 [Trapa incisa]
MGPHHGHSPHGRRLRHLEFDDNDDEDEGGDEGREFSHQGGTELDREIEFIIRRRNSASILQLLRSIRAGMISEYESEDRDRDRDRDGDRDRDRDRNRDRDGEGDQAIMINPFNQTMIIRGSNYSPSPNLNNIGSIGDYFVGPGLDLLLQHLAENDPNRYGTPPAEKEAIELMPHICDH